MARNAKGHFIKGTSGNPGGRSKAKTDYVALLRKAVTPDKWKAIIDVAIRDAVTGDRYARTWISDYLLGKPKQFVELLGEGDTVSKEKFIEDYNEDMERVYAESE